MSDWLDKVKARRAAITGLPWEAIATDEWPGGIVSKRINPQTGNLPQIGAFDDDANNEFAAHAPDDIDHLIAEVERLRRQTAPAPRMLRPEDVTVLKDPTGKVTGYQFDERHGP